MMKHLKLSFIILILLLISPLCSSSKTLHWNHGRNYEPFMYAQKEGILLDNKSDTLLYDFYSLSNPTEEFKLNFRSKNINGHPGKKYSFVNKKGQTVSVSNPYWGIIITGLNDTITIVLKPREKFTALEPEPCLEITAYNLTRKKNYSVTLTDKINPYDGDNLWSLFNSKGRLEINGGNKSQNKLLTFPLYSQITGFGFFAAWGDKILISDISVEFDSDDDESEETYKVEPLNYNFQKSGDEMEGLWTIFDRELEESLLKLGGNYNLICRKDGENYVFLYLDGATINSKEWKQGDTKLILSPTPFPGIYNVDWIDSMKQHFNKDVKAQRSDGNTIVIQFPYQSSKIRLRKIPE